MEAFWKDNSLCLTVNKTDGSKGFISLREIGNLDDWQVLTDQMIKYCSGKTYKSVTTWAGRVICTITDVIVSSSMAQLPRNSVEWQGFVGSWYGATLTTESLKSSIETRVAAWNKLIKPFLEFMQLRDIIPCDVLIPSMKEVGERIRNTSFDVSLIGEEEPLQATESPYLNSLLVPVSLSRTDAEYLDELQFDLERKRNKLKECLVKYWKTIKSHYEFGKSLLETVDAEAIDQRVNSNSYIDWIPRSKKPPIQRHFANPNNEERFAIFFYLVKQHVGFYSSSELRRRKFFPYDLDCFTNRDNKFFVDPFPEMHIDSPEHIPQGDRLDWCLGNIGHRDVAYISTLLIMLNPKFTPEALLKSNIEDKDGKTWLESSDGGFSYSINKERAKSRKKESLDDLSLEIISTVIEMTADKRESSANHAIKRRLFITPSKRQKVYVEPSLTRISSWMRGATYKSKGQLDNGKTLATFFPSLNDYGLGHRAISFAKIRATEGVLEWFKTGSVKAVSRKLGNSSKVALQHYLPKPLIAAFNTRQIRRFQNLLIIAATRDESYLLEAVDFNSLNEVHKFIADMLTNHGGCSSPLIQFLKAPKEASIPKGELIASVSKGSLSVLYLYRNVALNSCVDPAILSKIDDEVGISPLAVITLSKHLSTVLANHSDAEVRQIHSNATEAANEHTDKVNWSEFMMKRAMLS